MASGYIWEQCELPLRARRPILSLCNVGPLAATEQIVCIHDANVFRSPESYTPGFRLFYRMFLPRLARRAARLATVSHASRREIARAFSLAEDDIAVLPNGHEHVLNWRPEQSAMRDVVSRFRPFVLMIGSKALHKNNSLVLGLAEAFEALSVDIVVVGGEAPIFAHTPQGRAANVHFLGRVSDDDLACLYGRALCLAFPSRSEGFGLPLLEAMTLGCPVVASPIPSSLEVCGDSALFAALDDGESWLRSVERIAQSTDLRAELIGRGRVRARSFSWRQSAQGYLNLASWGRP
jgi:glycosyltransferase involved in cell wall biosynthesis